MFNVAADGTAYEITGPQDAPCVVLIHGLGLSMQLWDAHMEAFKGWQILRYDLYGHGRSRPTQDEASLTLYANQIANLMDQLGIAQAHIIGFSIGGMINRRFALDHSEKVASLVILNSPHNRGEGAQQQVEGRARAAREQGAFATFDAALQRWFTSEYLATGEGPKHVRNWREQVDDKSYAQTSWVLANGVRELIAPDPAVVAPALVMTCENDVGSTPKMSREITAEIEGARTIIVPEFKHLGLMENPDTFTGPIVSFLRNLT